MYELVKAHPRGIGLAGFGWYWGKRWPEVSMKEMQPCKSIKRAIQQYVDTVKVTDEDVVILRRLDDIGSRFGRSRLARSRSRSPRSASQAAQQDCPTNAALVQTIMCHSVMAIFYRILAPQVWSQEEWYRILDKGRSCGVHKDMQRRSSSLCNSQCHGYLLSKRTIGRVSSQVESDSPSCILHYDIVMSSTKAMLCNLRLQT